MSPLGFVVTNALAALVSGLLVYVVMRSRSQVRLAEQREKMASAQAELLARKESLEDSLRNVEESTRRKAMDEFLSEIRIEERHYTREHKVLFITRRCLVRQERIFFRNIPLSNWIEHEMPIEEGTDVDQLARTMSVFAPDALLGEAGGTVLRLLK